MIQLITSNNLIFTKPKCNCGIGSGSTTKNKAKNYPKKLKKNSLKKQRKL
uniref:Uncharacterized protein n=1 Tax=viral metagenome TaxID=1070528 RepID=A0A6C0EZE0_9ZZZZ